uniref:YidB family protein n=1 Tax=Luteimonas aquatica TaxID=450364 RepID=UPI001F5650F5
MFDALLETLASRFGISLDKAKQLLAALSALIFDPGRGGPAGFLERLRSGGLGEAVQSWIGSGPNQPVTAAQLENALGSGEIDNIAAKAGLDRATAAGALGGLLPEVIDRLSPDGQLPASMPGSLAGLLGGLGDRLGDLGRSGAAA